MAEEIVFKTRVDTGSSVKDVDKLADAMAGLSDSENEVKESTIDVNATFEDIYGDLKPMTSRIGEMEDRMYELAAAGKQNTVEFKTLQGEVAEYRKTIISVDRAVDQLAEQGRGLGTALQLGQGIVAGYGALQGTMALIGGESEQLEKQLVKLQAVQAVLMSLEELKIQLDSKSILLTKAKSAAQALYTTAVGSSTGALKAFRVALLATGIGAIIAGIGLLIANWDKLTEAIGMSTKAQQLSNQVQKEAISAISEELSAANKLSKVLNDEAISREDKVKAVKDLQAEYPELLGNIDAEQASIEEINTALQLNTQLLKLNAQAKAIEALRSEQYEKQLQAEVDIKTGANEGIINSIKALGVGMKAKDLAIAKSREAQMEAQKEINAYDELEKSIQNQIKALEAQGATNAGNEDLQKQNEARTKAYEARQAEAEEQARLDRERQMLMQDFMVQSIEDESLRRLEALRISHEREREQLVEKYGQDTELLKQLEAKQASEIDALNAELAEKELARLSKLKEDKRKLEQETIDQNLADERARLQAKLIQIENDFYAEQELKKELAFNEMITALQNEELLEGEKLRIKAEYAQKVREIDAETADHDVKVTKEAEEARRKIYNDSMMAIDNLANLVFDLRLAREEEGTRAYDEQAKKQFKINKAFQLTNATMEGYRAVLSAFAETNGGIVAKSIAAVSAGAFALRQIVAIATSKYKSSASAGGVTPPSISTPTETEETTAPTTLTEGLEGSGSTSNKVYLVDSELKTQLTNSEKTEIISTIG